VWFCPVTLPALAPLLLLLLALTCGVGTKGGFCISYRLFNNISHPSSSAGAPRSDRATALQADEEANHGHYPPLSDVCARILHESEKETIRFGSDVYYRTTCESKWKSCAETTSAEGEATVAKEDEDVHVVCNRNISSLQKLLTPFVVPAAAYSLAASPNC